jgi:hypothetical protein
MRLFTSEEGTAGIGFGKYTNATNFAHQMVIDQDGNVGIGTNSPVSNLDVSTGQIAFGNNVTTDSTAGLYWHDSSYGIYRTSGHWSGNYQQLNIQWATGIILNPGSGAHGKSHVGVVGGMSIGDSYYGTKYDNGLIVQGNVGIGTYSPSAPLHVKATGDTSPHNNGAYIWNVTNSANQHAIMCVRVAGTSAGNPFVSYAINTQNGWSTGIDNSDSNKFKIAGSWTDLTTNTWLTIHPTNGNVGIGTTDPGYRLHVNGNALIEGGLFLNEGGVYFGVSGTTNFIFNNGISFRWYISNSARMYLDGSGNLTTTGDITGYGSISDVRLKKNIINLDTSISLEKILKIRTVGFKWIDDLKNEKRRGKNDEGLIAQDIEKLWPSLVDEIKIEETDTPYKYIHYDKLTIYLTGAIQEHQKMIENQNKIIEQQQEMINNQQKMMEEFRRELDILKQN